MAAVKNSSDHSLSSPYPCQAKDQLHGLNYRAKKSLERDKDTSNRWGGGHCADLICLRSSAHEHQSGGIWRLVSR